MGVPGVNKLLPFGSVLGLAEGAILKMLQVYLKRKIPQLQVNTLHLGKSDSEHFNALELDVTILDYTAFTARLPAMLKKSAQTEVRLQPICDVLDIIGDNVPDMLGENVTALGNDTVDDIIITLGMGYNDLICERMNQILEQKGTVFIITAIDIKK